MFRLTTAHWSAAVLATLVFALLAMGCGSQSDEPTASENEAIQAIHVPPIHCLSPAPTFGVSGSGNGLVRIQGQGFDHDCFLSLGGDSVTLYYTPLNGFPQWVTLTSGTWTWTPGTGDEEAGVDAGVEVDDVGIIDYELALPCNGQPQSFAFGMYDSTTNTWANNGIDVTVSNLCE